MKPPRPTFPREQGKPLAWVPSTPERSRNRNGGGYCMQIRSQEGQKSGDRGWDREIRSRWKTPGENCTGVAQKGGSGRLGGTQPA